MRITAALAAMLTVATAAPIGARMQAAPQQSAVQANSDAAQADAARADATDADAQARYAADLAAYDAALARHDARADRQAAHYRHQQRAYADAMRDWRAQDYACRHGNNRACNAPSPDPAAYW
jgi:hypothetical protein